MEVLEQARMQEKNEPRQNFLVSRFYQMFPRFFTNKIFQDFQVQTLLLSESAPVKIKSLLLLLFANIYMTRRPPNSSAISYYPLNNSQICFSEKK